MAEYGLRDATQFQGRARPHWLRAPASWMTPLLLSLAIVSPAEGQKPSNLKAVANGDSAIDLSWTAPSLNFGQLLRGYKIESTPDTTMAWATLRANTQSTATTFTHSGLPPDTTIYYRVSAIILDILSIYTSGPSNVAGATTESASVGRKPGRPTDASAHAVDDTMIAMTWQPPTDTGTSAITGNRIEVSTDGGTIWTDLEANTGNIFNFYFHTGLTPDTTLHYRISAINQAGTGPPSETVFATTPGGTEAGAPGPPTDLAAKPDGPTTIDLEWEQPADTGSSAIEAYRIEVSSDSTVWTDLEAKYSATAESVEL